MNQELMKAKAKEELQNYLEGRGINTSKEFRCLNPLHEDKNPSMSYDKKRNKAHCFSCGVDYDLFDVVQAEYGLDEKEKFTKTYELLGMEEYKPSKEVEVLKDQTSFFKKAQDNLNKTNYLTERGIGLEIQKKYGIGYVEGWRSPTALREGKNPPKSNRIIIPTSKYSYLARSTEASTNSRFKAVKEGKVIPFNLEAIKNYKEGDKPIVVTEGEIDALSIVEAYPTLEAVALGSSSYVNIFLESIKPYPHVKLILALDNDTSGEIATEQLQKGLDKLGIRYIRSRLYAQYKDANDVLQADREGLEERLYQTISESEEAFKRQTESLKEAYNSRVQSYSLIDRFRSKLKEEENKKPIRTLFPLLDEKLGDGIFTGLYMIGAISSLGKSSFVLQLADNIASQGIDVLFFSLEMSQYELMSKSVSRYTFIDPIKANSLLGERLKYTKGARRPNIQDFKKRHPKRTTDILHGYRYSNYSKDELKAIDDAFNEYKKVAKNIYIVEPEGFDSIDLSTIDKKVKEHIELTGNKPVVIVDYLQILKHDADNYREGVDRDISGLKRISTIYDIPVIGISSFNRQSYKETASLSSFKESGGIEYGVDTLIALEYRATISDGNALALEQTKSPREIRLKVIKNRNESSGFKINLDFYSAYNTFIEVD